MKYLLFALPLIGALSASAQTKVTVDSLRHTVTVAKKLRDGSVDVHLYYWEDEGLRERVEFLTRQLVETRIRLDSVIISLKGAGPLYWWYSYGMDSVLFKPGRTSNKELMMRANGIWDMDRLDTTHVRIKLTTQ